MTNNKNCEYCMNFIYDEEFEDYVCDIDLDMDEAERFSNGSFDNCPYFRINNEYKIVEKQN
ncbi:MAG: DUF6472 family protein [Clostridiales bacterium]|nr:DUF6472 family protein [Clostridiales bacterium]